MKVPLNNPIRIFHKHQEAVRHSILKAIEGGIWLGGQATKLFAKNFAAYCGVDYCLPLANGTDALELSLRTLIDPTEYSSSEVITVANAGGYTSIACRLIGAIPVYADIDISTQLVDIDSIANCLGSKVKVVVLTHLYGRAVNVSKVREMLDKKGYSHVKIVEDCAQAHGAKIGSRIVGSFGDMAAFSFYPTKNLGAMGDAGAIVSSNKELFEKARSLSQYGWSEKYNIDIPYGRNSRMDEIQAAILNYLLPQLDHHNHLRKEIYNKYKSASPKLIPIDNIQDEAGFVAHLAVFRVANRDSFIDYMSEKNIAVGIHYPILDFEQKGWTSLEKRIDPITNMESSKKSIEEIVTLPCFPYMTEDETDYVCEAIKKWV